MQKSSIKNRTKTLEQYKKEIFDLYHDDITILGEYKNANEKVLTRCNKCGNEWGSIPYNLLNGKACPRCNDSKGEKRILQFLNENKYEYTHIFSFKELFYKSENHPLTFDFMVKKDDKIYLIEYNGKQHYEPFFNDVLVFEDTKIKDKIKIDYCKKQNIPFLVIKYTDYNNIEAILNNFLNSTTISDEL